MPHRRKPHKGSFGAHFDELVRHFPAHDHGDEAQREGGHAEQEKRSVHDRLFESAWRKQKEERRPS